MTLACLHLFAYAQVKVEGDVKDAADGQPLSGATILVKGKSGGVSSNSSGKFSISVPNNAILVISSLGFVTKEVPVNSQTSLSITLSREESEMKSVVVTALNIKRQKSALGYAVSEAGAKDITGFGETNPLQSLAGKMAGVNIAGTTAGPTGSTRITIRGIRELQGNNQPLYVIDGVPAVNGNLISADQDGGFDLGDGLSDINPNDIESISVLKGASAAALYGSRALNGVILINTKSGRSRKGLGIEVSHNTTIDRVSTKLDEVQKVYGQGSNGEAPQMANRASNITQSWGARYTDVQSVVQRDGSTRPYKFLDNNLQGFFRNGVTSMTTVAVTSGNQQSNFRASYSNVANKDITPKSGFNRNTFSLRGETVLAEKLTLEAKGTLTLENVTNRPALTDDVNNIGNGLLAIAGNFDQSWLNNYANPNGTYIDYTGDIYRANPYWTLNRTTNNSNKKRFNGSLTARYKVNDKLSFTATAGTDFYTFNFENFYDKNTPSRDGGILQLREIRLKEENYQAMINYNTPVFQDFKIGVMAGANMMRAETDNNLTEGKEIINVGKNLITNFKSIREQPNNSRRQTNSLFGSVELGWRDQLFLNLQGRNDWSSTLPAHNRSFFYPSADLSWVITNSFDLKSTFVNYAKLRASVGKVGSDAVPNNTALYYTLTGLTMHDRALGEILGNVIPNEDIKPQFRTSREIGFELGFLNDRIGIDFTYYDELTTNAIVFMPVSAASGYEQAVLNAARLRNKGVELMLKTTPVKLSNGLRWDLSFNYSKNVNKVEQLTSDIEAYVAAEARWAGATITGDLNEKFGTIRGVGIRRDANGQIMHDKGLPMLTSAPVALGNITPDWTGGITNTVAWKGFEFRAVLDIRVGGDIYSMSNRQLTIQGQNPKTLEGRDGWNEYQAEVRANPGVNVPQKNRGFIAPGVTADGKPNQTAVDPYQYWKEYSNSAEGYIYDGGFVKLRDVGLNYTLPKSLYKKARIQSITLGVIGRNLWIISKNTPNIDPESNYNNGNGQGFEYGSLPGRKRFGFNVLIKL
ncbi:SusC/RagA family TonB-linked outer membrane protein [Pseudoflavitalea sp. G-6-1-2]|uniref:SusC/RagA family TonB-linked outer membrane protein n=1 Tax=Pseudoflavitalea sp. G-6-1-2 TaxID=2728841 RepID=UPI00146DDE0E|nr:SusC/RagA family TonB-linked outer membrane protein [Pseudoflavitalea sp. G-6-1-2]NML21603.1 SusC/RagA family TonB-linked outer membrane protein [Pseudoflavitalea sp. G-6-1-2]